jgi:hypothetical protein
VRLLYSVLISKEGLPKEDAVYFGIFATLFEKSDMAYALLCSALLVSTSLSVICGQKLDALSHTIQYSRIRSTI